MPASVSSCDSSRAVHKRKDIPLQRKTLIYNAKQLRLIFVGCILFAVLTYTYISQTAYDFKDVGARTYSEYFVNTSGCRIPAMDVHSRQIDQYVEARRRIRCYGKSLLRAISDDTSNYIVLGMTELDIMETYNVAHLKELKCHYSKLKRINDFRNEHIGPVHFHLGYKFRLSVDKGIQTLIVTCHTLSRRSYRDILFFIPPPKKEELFTGETYPPHKLSVMIIGLDSVSHMNFLRQMPNTAAYIRNELPHVEFWGYNKVGRDSYPNLVPMFTGLNETELDDSCYLNNSNFDSCKFIWDDFKQAHYNTALGEDHGGTFDYDKHGFSKQPTDYYIRPITIEIHLHTKYSSNNKDIFCSGSRTFGQIQLEFLDKLLPHMQLKPFFSSFWWIDGYHDDFSYPQLSDKMCLSLLQKFNETKLLNHTILLFMSDHGLRYGPFRNTFQGMLEDSQPMLFIIYPQWLTDLYPTAIFNLHQNSHNLVTTFDLHETLKDILNYSKMLNAIAISNRTQHLIKLPTEHIPRGISLFLPIHKERNCDSAGIPSHFCLCHHLFEIDTSDSRVEQAAKYILNKINELIIPYPQCQSLYLEQILKAYISGVNENMIFQEEHSIKQQRKLYKNRFYEVRVRLLTSPNKAMYEGTARLENNEISLAGAVTRIDRYGNQSSCIDNHHIEMYCFCLNGTVY